MFFWIMMILTLLSLGKSVSDQKGQCAQGAIGEITSYSGDLARKTCQHWVNSKS